MNRIFVVSHVAPGREFDPGYSLLKVGSADFSAEFTDATGDNIASLNPFYSELTALYWIWKNYRCDPDAIVGMVHYRRFFGYPSVTSVFRKEIISSNEIYAQMADADMLVPQGRYFKYGLYGQYAKSHMLSDLDACLAYLKDQHWLSDVLEQRFKAEKTGAICNMLVTRKILFDEYCSWLFSILFAVEPTLHLGDREPYQRRGMGFLSERLFNLWLWSKPDIKVTELPIIRVDKSPWSNLNNARKYFIGKLKLEFTHTKN